MRIRPEPFESIDSALRRFKKAVGNAGILLDARRHEFYQTPSQRRRSKSQAARKRMAKNGW